MARRHNPGEPQSLGIAEAKRRFSELVDRVGRGERFVIRDVRSDLRDREVALVPAEEARRGAETKRVGLVAVAGSLADWEELPEVVKEIYAARRRARDRAAPKLD